ncbi:MAG: adenylate/guanylate cyclase domain-containing protein [Chloroflexi bacterium]|nr:adenylate/guanylate cyclase domain-containing protein [Chloroflexota bacterium]
MDKRFEELLQQYIEQDDHQQRKPIEEQLWREFGATKAVLIMDLSRFSMLTQKYGIVYNLAMVYRMQSVSQPLIEREGGQVIKYEADNCFAVFDDVYPAVRAALSINRAFTELNANTDEKFDILVGTGIDYGEVLLVEGPDYFGMAVNRASKLGEDIASGGEILITKTAFDRMPADPRIHAEPLELTISGLKLDALALKY